MRPLLNPPRLLLAGVLLLAVTALLLMQVHSNDFLLLPDPAHPVAPLVKVQGGHDPRSGGIYYVDVLEQRASLLQKLIPALRGSGSKLTPPGDVIPTGADYQAFQRLDREMMGNSQRLAAAIALRSLGYRVGIRPAGVLVVALDQRSHALGRILPGDVIIRVGEQATPTYVALAVRLLRYQVGEVVPVTVRRSGDTETIRVRLSSSTRTGNGVIGIADWRQTADVTLPLRVAIDAGNVGGPSAGLAFALDIRAELGHDPAPGYRVAATGELGLDGAVGAIGGIEQKTYGARQAHADVFLVPVAGHNARDARRFAHGLKIIPVQTFQQALQALATLPPKP